MKDKENLVASGQIAIGLIAKTYLMKEFHFRVQERIGRAEIKDFKKKFDTTALISVIALIVGALVLMILQFTIGIFIDNNTIVYILIPLAIIPFGIALTEFFIVRTRGYEKYNKRVSSLSNIEEKLQEQKKSHTQIYLEATKTLDGIKKVESKNFLAGLILKIYINLSKVDESIASKEILYRYLFRISAGKQQDVFTEISEKENSNEQIELLKEFMANYLIILNAVKEYNITPIYFTDYTSNLIENLTSLTIESKKDDKQEENTEDQKSSGD
ncbi:MAG: hypothetical protein ACTSO7_05530 [Candidatus Heimdallarchaeota archaeon]